MESHHFDMLSSDGKYIYIYNWFPSPSEWEGPPRGVVQIAHGMAETARRYERLARALTTQGYVVYANDHRGHGRTAGTHEELGRPGTDGFNAMVNDMILLGAIIKDKHPETPLLLLGHSMGSFLTQKVMYTWPDPYAAFMLSGTCGKRGMLQFGEQVARMQIALQGERHPSLLLNALVFGGYNRTFRPVRTAFDWLSRDDGEVDKYIADPECGVISSAGFFRDFFRLLQEIHTPSRMERIPKDKPVYLFSGEEDPVGMKGDGVRLLHRRYQELGLQDVECRLYPGARHEILNEINRDEVTAHLIDWMNQRIPLPESARPDPVSTAVEDNSP
ncbi:alpha/beta hydrolase [Paenibacillus tuaregi]|uniref:alpha/beta hydrolase n=1 Tax=Paenibacillus tuaregi TaxID=1816681 RepID=UPI00083822C3|nr:alpha/beta hydrolase [Paenibacillus tuaregi]